MTGPIQGGGPIDQPPIDKTSTPAPFPGDTNETKEPKINATLHPVAQWFVDNWKWPTDKALAAEKQFIKNIMQQCQHLMNKYKDIYKQLNPDNPENQ